MADKIQANCSVKKSDVLAVLTELAEVMTSELQDSKVVKIAGLGAFKLTLKCVGAESIKEFSPAKNIKQVNIRFSPEAHVDAGSKTRTKALVTENSLILSAPTLFSVSLNEPSPAIFTIFES